MSHERFDTQAAAHALGALDGEEAREFEAHLAGGCSRCEATLRESAEALAGLAREAPPAAPPPEVRAALMARVAATGRRDRTELKRAWLRWSLATAAAMVVGGFLAGMFVAARYEARLGKLAREASALREDLRRQEAALQEHILAYTSVVALLRDPATRVIALTGTGPSPDARGRVVWHDTAGGHLVVSKLPPPPAGHAYELWTIAGGKPAPAGVFQVDASGQAIHRVAPTGKPVEVFAITLEPAAGVPTPTGPIVLASRPGS